MTSRRSARRAARERVLKPAVVTARPGEPPPVLQIGPLVEVWGPDDAPPAGVGDQAKAYFRAATGRYRRGEFPIAPWDVHNTTNRMPPAWSLDGRSYAADFRLAPMVGAGDQSHRHDLDFYRRLLADLGLGAADVPDLRAQAAALLIQATNPPTTGISQPDHRN